MRLRAGFPQRPLLRAAGRLAGVPDGCTAGRADDTERARSADGIGGGLLVGVRHRPHALPAAGLQLLHEPLRRPALQREPAGRGSHASGGDRLELAAVAGHELFGGFVADGFVLEVDQPRGPDLRAQRADVVREDPQPVGRVLRCGRVVGGDCGLRIRVEGDVVEGGCPGDGGGGGWVAVVEGGGVAEELGRFGGVHCSAFRIGVTVAGRGRRPWCGQLGSGQRIQGSPSGWRTQGKGQSAGRLRRVMRSPVRGVVRRWRASRRPWRRCR